MERLSVGVPEAARLISISRRKMCYLLADGTIPSYKVGNRRYVLIADLRAFVRSAAA